MSFGVPSLKSAKLMARLSLPLKRLDLSAAKSGAPWNVRRRRASIIVVPFDISTGLGTRMSLDAHGVQMTVLDPSGPPSIVATVANAQIHILHSFVHLMGIRRFLILQIQISQYFRQLTYDQRL